MEKKNSNKGTWLGLLYFFLMLVLFFIGFAFDALTQATILNAFSFVYTIILCIIIETDND